MKPRFADDNDDFYGPLRLGWFFLRRDVRLLPFLNGGDARVDHDDDDADGSQSVSAHILPRGPCCLIRLCLGVRVGHKLSRLAKEQQRQPGKVWCFLKNGRKLWQYFLVWCEVGAGLNGCGIHNFDE